MFWERSEQDRRRAKHKTYRHLDYHWIIQSFAQFRIIVQFRII